MVSGNLETIFSTIPNQRWNQHIKGRVLLLKQEKKDGKYHDSGDQKFVANKRLGLLFSLETKLDKANLLHQKKDLDTKNVLPSQSG
jgi:hypothetical protein